MPINKQLHSSLDIAGQQFDSELHRFMSSTGSR